MLPVFHNVEATLRRLASSIKRDTSIRLTRGLGVNTLPGATLKDRLRIVSLLAGRGGRAIRRFLAIPSRALGSVRARAPERLLIAPQDIRTSDPTIAADIGAGYFAFGGKIVSAQGQSPFGLEPASDAWARQLAGFGWLRHLRAADKPGARDAARQLVDDFLAAYPKASPAPAWEPRVTARRTLAWLSQSPVILAGADRAFYLRFMQALTSHRIALDRQLHSGLVGDDRLLSAIAIAEFDLCAQASAGMQRQSTDGLATEIVAQILPDGGHVSRNPQMLIELLLDLLPLRQAYAARGIQAPQQMLNAIDRMMPMLRLFRHGDGTMALFNGMGLTAPELVATILAYDDARALPLTNAPHAGYQRIEGGSTIVIVDAGPIPPQVFSTQAHAGCLSFEMSSGLNRIVVNCGAYEGSRSNAREAARTSAAHSTLIVNDKSFCRFAAGAGLRRWLGDQVLNGPETVPVERRGVADGTLVAMSHDGYAPAFNLLHSRTLKLTADGTRLEGNDQLSDSAKSKDAQSREANATGLPYAIRFHLHPAVRAVALDGGSAIRLDLRDNESWIFESDMPAGVEPSILFAAGGGPKATMQIQIAADSNTHREIRWSFRKIKPVESPRA